MTEQQISFNNYVMKHYADFVATKYQDSGAHWPVISGHNVKLGQFGDYGILFFKHTGNPGVVSSSGIGQLSASLLGVPSITPGNIKNVREKLEKYFQATPSDALFIVKHDVSNLQSEMETVIQKHEYYLGLTPMKVFLSHKGIDKPKIREFKDALQLLGFDPWLDEDAMSAGVELERSLMQGFKDSCAAIFFITPSYVDENYLASEINYAIAEKRKKGNKFSLIALVLDIDGNKGVVPDLLQPYVWKEPRSDLEALTEIIKALPVKVGDVYWK